MPYRPQSQVDKWNKQEGNNVWEVKPQPRYDIKEGTPYARGKIYDKEREITTELSEKQLIDFDKHRLPKP